MKFIGLIGQEDESSFIQFDIEGGDNNDSIGDQMWISKDGKFMEIMDYADEDVFKETMELFEVGSRKAFKGAMMRMGVEWFY